MRSDMGGHIFIFATESLPNSDMLAVLGEKDIRGGLISIWKVEKDNPSQLPQVIARYMKAYPGLKHSRTSRDESRKFTNDDDVTFDIKDIVFMDKLESDKMEIVIESRNIEVKTSGHRTQQELQFFANSMMMALLPKTALQVTITDKVLKEYFSTLRSTPTAK